MVFQNIQDVQNALIATNNQLQIGLDRFDGSVAAILQAFLPTRTITFRGEQPTNSPERTISSNQLIIRGRAQFPDVDISEPAGAVNPGLSAENALVMKALDFPVTAIFGLTSDGQLSATIRYQLASAWRFSHSFPNLPIQYIDDDRNNSWSLDQLLLKDARPSLSNSYLIVATHQHYDPDLKTQLEPGLNFISSWVPTGMLGIFESLSQKEGSQTSLILHGQIILPSFGTNQPSPSLQESDLPWTPQPLVPGIHLQASLGIKADINTTNTPVKKNLRFDNTLLRLYSPISLNWLSKNMSYDVAIAYMGELFIPSIQANAPSAKLEAIRFQGIDYEMLIKGEFAPNLVTIDRFLQITIGNSTNDQIIAMMPDVVKKILVGIYLKELAFKLICLDGNYEFDYISFTVELDIKWTVFKDIFDIDITSIEIAVASPFNNQRWIFAFIYGRIQILDDLVLDVSVSVDSQGKFSIQATQPSDKSISLHTFCQKHFPNLPFKPPNISIADILIDANSESYYAFSMGIAEDTAWVIDEGISLPDIRISISSTDWQFVGNVEQGKQGIPIIKLLKKLGQEIGAFKDLDPPSSIDRLSLDTFSIYFNIQSKDFLFTCRGTLPLNQDTKGPILKAIIKIDIKYQQDGSYTKFFGGTLLVDDLEFDLIFEAAGSTAGNSKTFIATYHDPQGRSIKVDDLIKTIFGTEALKDKTGLTVSIKDLLFVYQSQTPASNYLFGADIEAGLNLSDLKLPDLPLIGAPFPPDQNLKLGMQVFYAKSEFRDNEVNNLNTLDSNGLKLPQQGLKTGFDLVALLRVGQDTKSLTLPIGLDRKGKGLVGTSSPNVVPNSAQPKLSDNIIQTTPASDSTQWVTIQKTFGPIHLERVGVGYQNKNSKLQCLLDASLTAAGLTLSLDGLGAEFSLNEISGKPFNGYTLDPKSPSAAKDLPDKGNQLIAIAKDGNEISRFRIFDNQGKQVVDRQAVALSADKRDQLELLKKLLKSYEDAKSPELEQQIIDAVTSIIGPTFNPTFDLKGLGIDYRNDPLEIGGAFLKQTVKPANGAEYTAYAGIAIIRTEKLSLTAIGSYSSYNGHPSLYIYAILNYPLGGPPFFFITGFAAGFGYNRSLTIPAIDAIASFPLVEEATKGDAPQSSDGATASLTGGTPSSSALADTITAKLQKLENYIQPSVGDIFIAAGIKFTTFKQVNSFALLIVKFGQRFEIDLLGLSTLVAPPTEVNGGKDPVAEVQLALKATFIPDEGFLSIQSQLTPNSYILSKACQLTGGFAFFCWFKDHPSGAKAGDFVITLGGYHPKFVVPKHYPTVPRLGINWQVNKPGDPYELVIKGQAYFALTAQALMAGGNLEALWSSTWEGGILKAWFKAGADFIITWQPYHYDASFYIDIGASYTFKILGYTKTISVDVGADLHIWGPEFAGTATIHLWIISVTVNFGDQTPKGLEPISWDTFKQSFLPPRSQVCSITLQRGAIRQILPEQEYSLVLTSSPPTSTKRTIAIIQEQNSWCFRIFNAQGKQVVDLQEKDVKLDQRERLATLKKLIQPSYWNNPSIPQEPKKNIIDAIAAITEYSFQHWIVNPKDFVFATNSVIPSQEACRCDEAYLKDQTTPDGKHTPLSIGTDQTNLAIASMGIEANITSKQMIAITHKGTDISDKDTDISDKFEFAPVLKAVPSALWGKPKLDKDGKLLSPDLNADRFVENTLAGFEIKLIEAVKKPDHTVPMDQNKLQYETKLSPNDFKWQEDFQLLSSRGANAWSDAEKSEIVSKTKNKRQQLLQAMGWSNADLDFGQPIKEGMRKKPLAAVGK